MRVQLRPRPRVSIQSHQDSNITVARLEALAWGISMRVHLCLGAILFIESRTAPSSSDFHLRPKSFSILRRSNPHGLRLRMILLRPHRQSMTITLQLFDRQGLRQRRKDRTTMLSSTQKNTLTSAGPFHEE